MERNRSKKAKVSRPRQNGRKPQGRARRSEAILPRPPQLDNYAVVHNRRLRWIAGAAISQNITFQNLLDTILVAATATTAFDLFYAVKLKKLTAWADPSAGGAATICVMFDGTSAGFVGDRKMHTDTSMSVVPAYVSCSPGKDTLASKFQLSSNANCFNLQCPAGTVIDLDLSFRGDTLGQAVAAQNATVAAGAGVTYFRGLDGLATATSNLKPPNGVSTI
jgi:hypothetical protein